MSPDQFVVDAIRTEAKITAVSLSNNHYNFLDDVISTIIQLGGILDQFKKNVFYNKPFKLQEIKDAVAVAQLNVEGLVTDLEMGTFPSSQPANDLPVNPRYFHAVVGVATEAVELLEALDLLSPTLDKTNLLEEFGDLNWYEAIGIDEAGGTFEQVLERVIAKLRARYPDKFTSENAINRDLVKERQILEGKDDYLTPTISTGNPDRSFTLPRIDK